jgi:hypothetical protein
MFWSWKLEQGYFHFVESSWLMELIVFALQGCVSSFLFVILIFLLYAVIIVSNRNSESAPIRPLHIFSSVHILTSSLKSPHPVASSWFSKQLLLEMQLSFTKVYRKMKSEIQISLYFGKIQISLMQGIYKSYSLYFQYHWHQQCWLSAAGL